MIPIIAAQIIAQLGGSDAVYIHLFEPAVADQQASRFMDNGKQAVSELGLVVDPSDHLDDKAYQACPSRPQRMTDEVARQGARAQPWGSDITFIALTGWGQTEDRRRTQEAGFDISERGLELARQSAAAAGHVKIAELLLKHGADPNPRVEGGYTRDFTRPDALLARVADAAMAGTPPWVRV